MAEFERGQTFLDKKASNIQGTKGKFFIAMNNADDEDDSIICFVMNTENNIEKYQLKCNKQKSRFIIKPNELSFIKNYTSIILKSAYNYKLSEILTSQFKLLDIAPETMQREIKNCIDFNYLLDNESKLIKSSFK